MMKHNPDNEKTIRVIKHAKVTKKRVQLKPIQIFKDTPVPLKTSASAPQKTTLSTPQFHPENHSPSSHSSYMTEEDFEKQKKEKRKQIDNELETYKKEQQKEIERQKETVYNQAHTEGYSAGYEEAQAEFKEKTEELFKHINALAQKRKQVLKHTEREVLDLALAIAKKVIQTELELDPDRFTNIFEEALSRITQKDEVIVKVNPKDADAVRAYIDTHKKALNDIKRLEIYEDAEIEKGGCLIETRFGYIDSSISTKLDIIGQALEDEFDQYIIDPEGNSPSVARDDFESEEIDFHQIDEEDTPEDIELSDF